jgi:hypothetical protein
LVGQPAITGAVLSTTVTVKVQVLVLPELSFTVYVTVVVPTEKVALGKCDLVHTKLPDPVQLSVAVGSAQFAT